MLPAYIAGYWSEPARWAPLRATCISGLDPVDDRGPLSILTVSVLVLAGRHDVMCGVRLAEQLHPLIPGSRPVIVEHSGHFGHLEQSLRFVEEVAGFVEAGGDESAGRDLNG